MDQLKKFMAQVAKHQFWIISGLSVVLGIVAFYLTSSTLSKLYADQAAALDKLYGDINTVSSGIAKHPNDLSKAKMGNIIADVQKDVEAAWRLQYERQTKLLVWPEAALNNKRLVDKLKKYSPIETTLTYPEEPVGSSALVKTEKEAYARYFTDQLPEIVKIIGCEWVGKANENAAAAGGMGGMGMGMSGGMDGMDGGMGMGGMSGGMGGMSGGMGGMSGGMGGPGGDMGMMGPGMLHSNDLVIWHKPSQDELINSIRLWRGTSPTIYEILYTQENMWILEGIMRIIAKTNEGAKANFQTSIKEIEFIRIGKPAVGRAGTIDTPMEAPAAGQGGYGGMADAMGGGDNMGGMEGMMAGMGGMGAEGGMSGGDSTASASGSDGEGGAVVISIDPSAGRYVDSTYAPLSGGDLRTRMQSESPEDAYFAVAKRVPVRLRFKMDQRRVPQFLADCGNADLMLEIRQVRLGDTTPAPTGSSAIGMGGMGMGGGMGGMGGGGRGGVMGGMDGGGGDGGYGAGGAGGMDGGMGGMGMGGMGMGGMGTGGMGTGGMTSTKPSWEMPVEVYGVIYLYNPVSIKRLGLDKVTENTEVADKVETPAVTEPVLVAAPTAASNAVPANPNSNPNVPVPASGAPASGAPAGSATANPAEASGAQSPANPQ